MSRHVPPFAVWVTPLYLRMQTLTLAAPCLCGLGYSVLLEDADPDPSCSLPGSRSHLPSASSSSITGSWSVTQVGSP